MSGYNYYSLKKCRCYRPINKKLIETGSGGNVIPDVVNFKVFSIIIKTATAQRNDCFTQANRPTSPFGINSIDFFFLSLNYNTNHKTQTKWETTRVQRTASTTSTARSTSSFAALAPKCSTAPRTRPTAPPVSLKTSCS